MAFGPLPWPGLQLSLHGWSVVPWFRRISFSLETQPVFRTKCLASEWHKWIPTRSWHWNQQDCDHSCYSKSFLLLCGPEIGNSVSWNRYRPLSVCDLGSSHSLRAQSQQPLTREYRGRGWTSVWEGGTLGESEIFPSSNRGLSGPCPSSLGK